MSLDSVEESETPVVEQILHTRTHVSLRSELFDAKSAQKRAKNFSYGITRDRLARVQICTYVRDVCIADRAHRVCGSRPVQGRKRVRRMCEQLRFTIPYYYTRNRDRK